MRELLHVTFVLASMCLVSLSSAYCQQSSGPDTLITVDLKDKPLDQILIAVLKQAEVKYRFEAPALAALKAQIATIHHDMVPFRSTLEALVRSARAGTAVTYAVVDGEYVFSLAPPAVRPLSPPSAAESALDRRLVTLSVEDSPVADILDKIVAGSGFTIVVHRDLRPILATRRGKVDMTNMPASRALDHALRLARSEGSRVIRILEDKTIYLLPLRDAKPGESLKDRTFSYDGKPGELNDVIERLFAAAGLTGYAFSRETLVGGYFERKVENERIGDVLKGALEKLPPDKSVVLEDGPGILTLRPMIPRMPGDAPRSITMQGRDLDVRYALKAVFALNGSNYTLGQAVAGTVSVTMKDLLFDDALQLILKSTATIAPLTVKLEDGVYKIDADLSALRK